jgi:hypothetical protein
MAIPIVWEPGPAGREELWLSEAGRPLTRVLIWETPATRETVDLWAMHADSVPEFLAMLHLEGLIDRQGYDTVLRQHDCLYAAACALLECLPHRWVGERIADPTRELFPLIERMAEVMVPFLEDSIARAIIADALGTYWASWVGRYECLDHDVNAARQVLNEAMIGATAGIRILCPGDLTLTPEAVRAMIGAVVESHPQGEA